MPVPVSVVWGNGLICLLHKNNKTTSKRKKSTSKKVDEPKSATVIEPQSTKVDWQDAVNPFKLSDLYTEDEEEINLIALLEMLSDTEDEDCDFETDETEVDDSAADDTWL